MITDLGPRVLHAHSAHGALGNIQVDFKITMTISVLDDGSSWTEYSCRAKIESSLFSWEAEFLGTDGIQVTCRAIRVSGVYIWKICADNAISIYSLEPGDIQTEDDVFFA